MVAFISRDRLLQLVDVQPDLGLIKWKKKRQGVCVGTEAGSRTADGRHQIWLDRRNYLRYRIIWFYVHDVWPKTIDHINRNPGDDRISNLREATTAQNMWNTGPTKCSSTGIKGVYRLKEKGLYLVQAKRFQRTIALGSFRDLEQAKAAYARFAAKHDGEFFYHGTS